MRLQNELDVLAHAAPPPPDPDLLLRRARSIRHRRAVIVPAAAVVAVLVLTITYLSRVDDADPVMTLTFQLDPVADRPQTDAELEQVQAILQARASAAGLRHARVHLDGDRVLLDFDQDSVDVVYPDRLIAPGRLEVRQVVEGTQGHAMPADPKGPEASTLEELVAKIGQATWARVTNLDGVSGEMFRGFAELTPREVRLLPARVQFQVPTVGCEQLTADPFGAAAPPDTQVTACLDHEKLLLDRTAISGTDVADAMAEEVKRPGDFIEYRVRLKLTPTGRAKWTDLTRRVAAKQGCVPVPGSAPCRLAFVVDGKVLSAPVILNPMGADEAVITGLYTQAEARGLAVTLGPRELPPGLKLTSR